MPRFLAVYTMQPEDLARFRALPKEQQDAIDAEGLPKWEQWQAGHAAAFADGGGMVGKTLRVTREGMLLERMDHSPLALPYLEEQLPGGRTHFSSEANGQQIGLWVAPQRCVDDASGAVSHLTAELRLGDDVFRGCAYYGGARND